MLFLKRNRQIVENGTVPPKEELFDIKTGMTVPAVVTNIVSSCTITAMSLDRLFAVSSPHQYTLSVTKAKIKVFIAVVWIYSLLFSSLGWMGVSVTVFVVLYCHIHVSVPLVILPVVYWKTYRALRLHNNQVRNLADEREKIGVVHRRRERKMVSAFLLVLISFFVTFLPQYIAQNIYLLSPSVAERSSFRFFLYASNKFVFLNCTLNPFIYAWRIPKYRRAFYVCLQSFFCKGKVTARRGSVVSLARRRQSVLIAPSAREGLVIVCRSKKRTRVNKVYYQGSKFTLAIS